MVPADTGPASHLGDTGGEERWWSALASAPGVVRRRPCPAARRVPCRPCGPGTGRAGGGCSRTPQPAGTALQAVVKGQYWSGSRTRDRPFSRLLYPPELSKACEPGIEPGEPPRLATIASSLRRHTRQQQTQVRFPRTGGVSPPARGPLQQGCDRCGYCEERARSQAWP